MAYYAVQTSENKEFEVKERILSLVKNSKVFVPTKLSKVPIGKNTFLYYEKLLPEYVILEHDAVTNSIISVISEIRNVELFVKDKMDEAEAKMFIVTAGESQFNIFKGKANIILGEYAGNSCEIVSVKNDEAVVVVENSSKAKIRVPIWNLGKKSRVGQE